MSVPVDLDQLADEMAKYRFAYLMTVSDDGAPHAVAVSPTLQEGQLMIGDMGRHTRQNAQSRPELALVWPPLDIDGYSLIVDGRAKVDGESVLVRPTRAVLHRPAPAPVGADAGEASTCQSDCIPLE